MKELLGKIKKHPYICVCVIEMLFLISSAISILSEEKTEYIFNDENPLELSAPELSLDTMSYNFGEYETDNIHSKQMNLVPGIYDLEFKYSSTSEVNYQLEINPNSMVSLYANNIILKPGDKKIVTNRIWVNTPSDFFTIRFFPGEGNVSFDEVSFKEASVSRFFWILKGVLLALLINAIAALIIFRKRLSKYMYVILGILIITLLSSLGVSTRYIVDGHDLHFHLLRIAGIGDGIFNGQFPVKIEPNWINGWGYAVSAMYGDITLLLPALMYKAGFTLMTSYKTFVVLVNFLTALIAYECFLRISKNKYAAMAISFIYTMAPYRLVCIYTRAAVGEYTAFLFTPLIILGFYYAFNDDYNDESYGTKLLAPVLGFTGLIQTHVLSTQMLGIFLLILILVEIRKVFRKKTFTYLLKMAGFTILLNLWFVVPFLRFFTENFRVSHMNEFMDTRFQAYGVSLAEMFAQNPNSFPAFNFEFLQSLGSRCSMPLSNALFIILLAGIIIALTKSVKNMRVVVVFISLSLLAAWMSTNLFPYYRMSLVFPKISAFIGKIQFAYRYLGLAIVIMSFAAALIFRYGRKCLPKKVLIALSSAILLIAFDQGVSTIDAILYNGSAYTPYSAESLDDFAIVSGEYLYEGVSEDYCRQNNELKPNNVDLGDVNRDGLAFDFNVKATSDDSYVDVPIFNYPTYSAEDKNGESLKIEDGENHSVRVRIPNGYEGNISVNYKEPVLWRICEIISLAGLIFFVIKQRKEIKDCFWVE
ncbi:MAG: hypothetical protein MJZ11_04480 [Lachnospiraceae bacterium]|nr:hypothetical protein [Lachnospiraceae bacterium]